MGFFSSKGRSNKIWQALETVYHQKRKVFDSVFSILLFLTYGDGTFQKKNPHPDLVLVATENISVISAQRFQRERGETRVLRDSPDSRKVPSRWPIGIGQTGRGKRDRDNKKKKSKSRKFLIGVLKHVVNFNFLNLYQNYSMKLWLVYESCKCMCSFLLMSQRR